MRGIFAPCLDDVTEEDLYALNNEVCPSFIRVEADEATYNLHIILRFDMERAIFSGRLTVDELPGAWNAAFEKYMGIKVDTLGDGMLQDVHWSMASFGYFPTYTLGNLIAAQLKYALEKRLGPIGEIIEKRRLGEVREWLNENIHRHGRLKSAEEIVRDSTGGPLNPGFFDQYLREKYGELYGF
jgi:carboxypeptidase Taq